MLFEDVFLEGKLFNGHNVSNTEATSRRMGSRINFLAYYVEKSYLKKYFYHGIHANSELSRYAVMNVQRTCSIKYVASAAENFP